MDQARPKQLQVYRNEECEPATIDACCAERNDKNDVGVIFCVLPMPGYSNGKTI